MKVICAGMSKTGTKSMAKSLRILGYTVYDYVEHEKFHIDEWLDIYRLGKSPDFASMYQGVDAVTDLPAAFWYEEIFQAFPDAKVVLTIRDNDEIWVQSRAKESDIIINCGFLKKFALRWFCLRSRKTLPLMEVMNNAAFGTLRSKSTILYKKKYREHNQRVQAIIPKEKLLTFNVKQGWKPLCEFLGCDVPEQAFPMENVEGSFLKNELSKYSHVIGVKIFFSLAFLVLLVSTLLLFHF